MFNSQFFLITKKIFNSIVWSFGIVWVIVEPFESIVPGISTLLRDYWWIYLVIGILIGVFRIIPSRNIKKQIDGTDICIEIKVGNILKIKGLRIFGTNSTFDTSLENGIISKSSLQGQITKKYFESFDDLNRQIEASMDVAPEILSDSQKPYGNKNKYPIGTVASVNSSDGKIYFLAISNLNEHKVASTSIEDIKQALLELWGFCRDRGEYGQIYISILGTGFSRLNENRDQVIKEIVHSFIVSCNEAKIGECLTIIIHKKDYWDNKVNMSQLEQYLEYACTFVSRDLRRDSKDPIGSSIN